MDAIYLICYGDSEENIKTTIDKKIIGVRNQAKIPDDQLVYLVIKRDGEWTVVGNALVAKEVDVNPFTQPNKLRTYEIKELKECRPFSISGICKQELGSSYGLVLRSPKPIFSKAFIQYLLDNFTT